MIVINKIGKRSVKATLIVSAVMSGGRSIPRGISPGQKSMFATAMAAVYKTV